MLEDMTIQRMDNVGIVEASGRTAPSDSTTPSPACALRVLSGDLSPCAARHLGLRR